MQTKKIYIKGMHCVACEKLLKDEFDAVEGVIEAKVDRKTDSAEIFYENTEPDFLEIKKTAKKFGYDAFETKEQLGSETSKLEGVDWTGWIESVLIVVILFVLYRIFRNLGFLDWLDIQSSNVTLGVAFLTGIVASVSTCLAVVGSVVIAFGEKYRSVGSGFYEQALKPNLKFHAGRIIAFFILGGILGMIGGELSISGRFYFVFNIAIAFIMLWLGLNILGLMPSISNLGIKMPRIFTGKWNNLKMSEHKAAPFLLGAMSFFLPCGFTQSMQIFAVASGSFWTGAMVLLFFALGTIPALLSLGAAVSWTQGKKMATFQKIAGFLIIAFAVYTFNTGLALKDVSGSVLSTKQTETVAENKNQDKEPNKPIPEQEEQVVEMKLTYKGYEPSTLRIKKGIPVKWIVKGEQVTGCTNQILVPELNIQKKIQTGENIIKFTPTKAGTIDFSCWMGMVRGKFIVE